LKQFVPLGKSLEKVSRDPLVLDEFNRSFTFGSRKTAKAQVYIIPGNGQVYINGFNLCDFFTELRDRQKIIEPFELADCLAKYNVWAMVTGGGKTGIKLIDLGQADAISVAVARGLAIHEKEAANVLENGI
jgi:small subunit ribosomal protein S9